MAASMPSLRSTSFGVLQRAHLSLSPDREDDALFNDGDLKRIEITHRRSRSCLANSLDHLLMRYRKDVAGPQERRHDCILAVRMYAGASIAQVVGVEEERRAVGLLQRSRGLA